MASSDPLEEKILRRIPQEILVFSGILAIAAILAFDALTGIFIFVGGGVSALSFIWLRQSLVKFLSFSKKKAIKSAIALYGLRLVLILAVFFIIIFFFSTKIIAFVAGFSTIIGVFFVEAVAVLSRLKKWKN